MFFFSLLWNISNNLHMCRHVVGELLYPVLLFQIHTCILLSLSLLRVRYVYDKNKSL